MERHLTLDELFKKAEELQVVPFLAELTNIVVELKPILENINRQIEENVNKVPEATQKLKKVTEATEFATTEIMNTLDGIYEKIDDIKVNFPLKTDKNDNDSQKYLLEKLDAIVDDNNTIMMALQVQDITSQQIAAVNHLLNAMQKRLSSLLSNFQTTEIAKLITAYNDFSDDSNVETMHREIAFDPNAINAITNKVSRQNDIDDLIKKLQLGEISDNELKNFGDSSVIKDESIENEHKIEQNETTSDEEDLSNLSQDEINSLFGGGDLASQDDINKLFNT